MNPGLQRHLLLWVGCLAGRLQILPSLLELLPRAAPSCPSYSEAPSSPLSAGPLSAEGREETGVILGWDRPWRGA